MKIIVFLIGLTFISLPLYAQESGFIESLAQESCTCMSKTNIEGLSQLEAQNKFGTCIIQEAMKYQDDIAKEYGIDMANLDNSSGEKLGTLVATKMLGTCPELLTALANMKAEKGKETQKNNLFQQSGKIIKIEKNQFITVELETVERRNIKLLWLEDFQGSSDLKNLDKPKNVSVDVTYEVLYLYDPKIEDYSNFNVIRAITIQ